MSCRAFLDLPVDDGLLRDLVAGASRSPSGGNVQPWRLWLVNGERMADFQRFLADHQPERPEYDVYPSGLWEPHRSARFEVGEAMYELLGIPREDKRARLERMAENYNFFGAPAAFFLYLDRRFGAPQWSDCGMFLQTFMLLAQEAGLATCAQEIWASRYQAVSEFVGAPGDLMLFCGMAIGYADSAAAVNQLRSARIPFDDFAAFA